jgi:hypothetical protein
MTGWLTNSRGISMATMILRPGRPGPGLQRTVTVAWLSEVAVTVARYTSRSRWARAAGGVIVTVRGPLTPSRRAAAVAGMPPVAPGWVGPDRGRAGLGPGRSSDGPSLQSFGSLSVFRAVFRSP